MEHDIIIRDAYSVSWAEIWEFSKSQSDIIDAITISKNNCIWDNLQCCLLVPRSRSKAMMLTFDLQSREVLFILFACITYKDNYDIGIYWRDIALAICSRSHPPLNINIERKFEATLWRHRWRHHHKNFFWHNLGRSFHIWGEVKLKLCLIFKIFKTAAILSSRQTFFTGSYTGSWIYQKDSHEHFRHFELLIDALAQLLTEIYQFQNLTNLATWWRHRWRHECVKHNLHN